MEANVLDCGRFGGEEGCNDNADGFGLVVQKSSAAAAGMVWLEGGRWGQRIQRERTGDLG